MTLIFQQEKECPHDVNVTQASLKRVVKSDRRRALGDEAKSLHNDLPPKLQKAMDLESEKGSSTWLMTLPIMEHKFALHKGSFRDALCLWYGWQPSRLPSHCVCGLNFSVEHALSCPCGGLPSIRHNDIRDLTAKLLTGVCSNVSVEPAFMVFEGTGIMQRAFFDVRVFNPLAPSNCRSSLAASYKQHESTKRRNYEQRVCEVHATGLLSHRRNGTSCYCCLPKTCLSPGGQTSAGLQQEQLALLLHQLLTCEVGCHVPERSTLLIPPPS